MLKCWKEEVFFKETWSHFEFDGSNKKKWGHERQQKRETGPPLKTFCNGNQSMLDVWPRFSPYLQILAHIWLWLAALTQGLYLLKRGLISIRHGPVRHCVLALTTLAVSQLAYEIWTTSGSYNECQKLRLARFMNLDTRLACVVLASVVTEP